MKAKIIYGFCLVAVFIIFVISTINVVKNQKASDVVAIFSTAISGYFLLRSYLNPNVPKTNLAASIELSAYAITVVVLIVQFSIRG